MNLVDGSQPHDCLLCGEPGEDPRHLAHACSHTALVALRPERRTAGLRLLRRMHAFLQRHAARIYIAPCENDAPGVTPLTRLGAALATASLTGAEGSFILQRLQDSETWPACVVPESWPLALVLGEVWDAINVTPFHLRGMLDMWLRWSRHWVARLAETWRAAVVELQQSVVVDEAAGDEGAAAVADQRFPRGSLLHTSLSLLVLPWGGGSRNGQCEYCHDVPEMRGRQLAQDPLCNRIACADCVGLRGRERRMVAPDVGDLEWLCSQCTALWLRRAVGGDDAAGWAAACCGATLPQPVTAPTRGAGDAAAFYARWLPPPPMAVAAPSNAAGGSVCVQAVVATVPATGSSGAASSPPAYRALVLYGDDEAGQAALRLWHA
jgi:hypothetical protein